MKLNAAEVKYLKCPDDKSQIKKADGKGLFLLIKRSGSKLWRYKYTFAKKAQEMSLGAYPGMSLADARKAHESARVLLNQGINPSKAKQEEKIRSIKQSVAFNDVAIQWWDKQKREWSKPYSDKVKKYIDDDLKRINKLSLDRIDYSIITKIMLDIEARGNPRKASLALSIVNRILNHAKAKQLIEVNPTTGMSLVDLLGPMPKIVPRAAILNVKHLKTLINDIENNESGTLISRALKLIPHIFLRPGEVSCLKWTYIDYAKKRIYLPKEVMKSKRDFIVPMSKQVEKQITDQQKLTGYSDFIFPNARNNDKFLSKNVLTNRLRALNYEADVMSAHGFRSTATTVLIEDLEWDPLIVDTQLAHLTGTATSRAYNRLFI